MAISAARLAANRQNAAKSSGPKTVEGKERSRRNALKHGLTGAGIVLPTEDLGAIEARFADFEEDLRPSGGVARFLVQRAALLSVRLDRAAIQEAASLTASILAVGSDMPTADADAGMESLFEALQDRPSLARQELLDQPAGIDRLVAALRTLQARLNADPIGAWGAGHAQILEALLGHDPAALPARSKLLSDVVLGDCSQLRAAETADLDMPGKQRWAADRLARLIDAEVEQLQVHQATLPPTPPRIDSPEARRALFDGSRAAVLARRYEASTERALFRTLKEIRQLNAEQAARQEVAAFDPARLTAELASFGSPPLPPRAEPILPPPPPFVMDFGLDRGRIQPMRTPDQVVVGRPPGR